MKLSAAIWESRRTALGVSIRLISAPSLPTVTVWQKIVTQGVVAEGHRDHDLSRALPRAALRVPKSIAISLAS